MLTVERLKALLSYNPNTGHFTRLVSTSNRIRAGDFAGGKNSSGYWTISVGSKRYLAHRLAWLYMTGAWPQETIDHINCKRSDNRFINLREATQAQNSRNSSIRTNNKSGFKGVSFNRRSGKWVAFITAKDRGGHLYLGYHDTPELAAIAYEQAAKKLHGEFARV